MITDEGVTRVDGHYCLPLPFKSTNPYLPNNRSVAEKRLQYLKRRFDKDPKFLQHYKTFMENLLEKGHARKASNQGISGQTWYLPHHGVYNPNKPNKVRVVLDCGAEFRGRSLNKELLSGPDLTNKLVGVLCRFRRGDIGIMADIQSMFYQVFVPEKHRSFLRFLWFDQHDTTQPPSDYEMTVHVFGGTSSPSCCNYALKSTAIDNKETYKEDVCKAINDSFFMDDMLESKDEEAEAIRFAKEVKALCNEGKFNLTKFVSNSIAILKTIAKEDLGESAKDVDLLRDQTDRALGVLWNLSSDTFKFVISSADKPLTRRGILSTLSSIYDPLGLISPFLLQGRLILQQLCALRQSWDTDLPQEIAKEWIKWYKQLQSIHEISINRCFKPKGFTPVEKTLHHFSDASEKGYGEATYIRQVNNEGQVHCALVLGKSRVCPIKFVTMPRLELTAARLSTTMSIVVKHELRLKDVDETFWTDSEIVLSYLQNTTKRFKTFVANRIERIKESSNVADWYHVSSSENPADIASRGIDVSNKTKADLWFNGPDFLWKHEATWKQEYQPRIIQADDPEVKKVNVVGKSSTPQDHIFEELLNRKSNWRKLCRIVAWVNRFVSKLKGHKHITERHLTVDEIQAAGGEIIQFVQKIAFNYELSSLKKGEPIRSNIANLNPFIDENGFLRVGGRLRRSEMDQNAKHPVLLPKKHKLSVMIIRWCHELSSHRGRGHTLNELRARGFWVVNGNSAVRGIIFTCVTCRRLRGKSGYQIMSDLPRERVEEAPPFTYVGMDFFGPFVVKERRKELKNYGVIFTCFGCRGSHLEVASNLETDTFILALRRFIARRGQARIFYSDNGTNFVGANKELKQAIQELDQTRIADFLTSIDIDWKWNFNPPASSHMGGVWERQIRTIRSILSSLMKCHGQSLDTEALRTLMTEVEAIINSRPLTTEAVSDPNSEQQLSPINLLTMKSKVILPPPGNFTSDDLYSRKRWRRVQHIANEFWSRWRKEYLQSLQRRSKWASFRRNFAIGDIVLLKDNTLMDVRNNWPLGKVVTTFPDSNGQVRFVDVLIGRTRTEATNNEISTPCR